MSVLVRIWKQNATLCPGAQLRRDEKAGGYVVEHVYQYDLDLPNQAPPLARRKSLVREGETVVSIDGTNLLSVHDERELLRGKAGTQVMLQVKPKSVSVRCVIKHEKVRTRAHSGKRNDAEIEARSGRSKPAERASIVDPYEKQLQQRQAIDQALQEDPLCMRAFQKLVAHGYRRRHSRLTYLLAWVMN